jgi:catechol 2,3-dioxygenase
VPLPNYVPHIIAFNTWAGRGAPPAHPDTSGLRHFTITSPGHDTLTPVVDRLKSAQVPLVETSAGLLLRGPAGKFGQSSTKSNRMIDILAQ